MIVEFKLRKQLTPVKLIQLSRQIRWYAWARQQVTDRKVVGVLVDERLNEAPKPAGFNKNGELSHAKNQVTTPELYFGGVSRVGRGAASGRSRGPGTCSCVAATGCGVLHSQ